MSWWHEFASRTECNADMGRLTWFRLGGRARYLFRPRNAEDLSALMVRVRQEALPVKVLGCGANVLIRDDGFDGVVVRLESDVFRRVDPSGEAFTVGGGVDLMPLARHCSERGYSGLECMAGIPATVGGAIKMNAGGPAGDFSRVVESIDLLGPDGEIETWPQNRIGFGYRHSHLGDRIVLSAKLALVEDDPSDVKRTFDDHFTCKQRTQPLAEHSAGCIFKNPADVSAGALIDQAGLKGTRCGGAAVSNHHANFIIAQRGATASDIIRLIDLVRDRVCHVFGTKLELEIDIW